VPRIHFLRALSNVTQFGPVIKGFGLRRESAPDVSQRLSMPTRQGLGNFTLRTEANDLLLLHFLPPESALHWSDEDAEELEEKLLISSRCQKLALVGLGEIGKTQVALEHAYTVKKHWPESSIFWVSASSADNEEETSFILLAAVGGEQAPERRPLHPLLRAILQGLSSSRLELLSPDALR